MAERIINEAKEEGKKRGEEEYAKIVSKAERKAEWEAAAIIIEAKQKAEKILKKAA